MENPSYIVLSQQMGLRRQMDVIANNLANVNTSAFKAERMLFTELLTGKAGNPGTSGPGARISFLGEAGTLADMREGQLQSTGNQLDFAIHGPGYFSVETPGGPRYTRDGRFELDGRMIFMPEFSWPRRCPMQLSFSPKLSAQVAEPWMPIFFSMDAVITSLSTSSPS